MDLFTAAKNIAIIDVYNRYTGKNAKMKKGKKSTPVPCPFHEDRRPSMNLYPNNTYYCFSCHEGGTNIDFIMKLKNLDSATAAKMLCEDFGVEYEEKRGGKTTNPANVKGLIKTNEMLMNYFHLWLADAPDPKYFEKRGLGELVEPYSLGYCPKGKVFAKPEVAMRYGLGDERGECMFAGRYIVPIKDEVGTVIGFVGRLPDEEVDQYHPKYMNSADSEVFNKRKVFFNAPALNGDCKEILIVEGAFDALSYIVAGIPNVISPLGCSLSDEHIKILKRHSDKIPVLGFDKDEAGRKATEKAIYYAKYLKPGILTGDYKGAGDANEALLKLGKENMGKTFVYLTSPEYVIQEAKNIDTLEGRKDLWVRLAKILGNAPRAEKFPLNNEYTQPEYDYYWGLYAKMIAMHPIQ